MFSKIKEWSTRKKLLIFVILCGITYTLADMCVTIAYANTGVQISFDSTLTSEFFNFIALISGLSGGLSVADIISETVISVVDRKPKKKKKTDEDDEVKG